MEGLIKVTVAVNNGRACQNKETKTFGYSIGTVYVLK